MCEAELECWVEISCAAVLYYELPDEDLYWWNKYQDLSQVWMQA